MSEEKFIEQSDFNNYISDACDEDAKTRVKMVGEFISSFLEVEKDVQITFRKIDFSAFIISNEKDIISESCHVKALFKNQKATPKIFFVKCTFHGSMIFDINRKIDFIDCQSHNDENTFIKITMQGVGENNKKYKFKNPERHIKISNCGFNKYEFISEHELCFEINNISNLSEVKYSGEKKISLAINNCNWNNGIIYLSGCFNELKMTNSPSKLIDEIYANSVDELDIKGEQVNRKQKNIIINKAKVVYIETLKDNFLKQKLELKEIRELTLKCMLKMVDADIIDCTIVKVKNINFKKLILSHKTITKEKCLFNSEDCYYYEFEYQGDELPNDFVLNGDEFQTAPNFFHCKPSKHMELDKAKYGISDRYRLQRLRQMAQQINDPIQEMFFFKHEMDSKLFYGDSNTTILARVLFLLPYKLFSYGNSIIAPLVLWLIFTYIFSIFYMFMPEIEWRESVFVMYQSSSWLNPFENGAFLQSAKNGLLFLGGSHGIKAYEEFVLLQKIVSFPLVFLFGLAVRNLLRMR